MSLKIRMLLLCVFCSLVWLELGIYFLGSLNHKTQLIMDMSRSGFFDWLAGAIAGASLVLLLQHGLSLFRVRARYGSCKPHPVGLANTNALVRTPSPTTSLADDVAPWKEANLPDEIKSQEERDALNQLLRSGVKVRFKQ